MKCRKYFLLSFMILILLYLAGCGGFDSRELDNRSIILGLGIDKGEEHAYAVTIQLPILHGRGDVEGPQQKEFELFTSEGETLQDAMANLEAMTPTVLFFGHLKVISIAEEVAEDGLLPVIDLLDRNPAVANQIFMIIIKGESAQEFLSLESPLISLPSLYLNDFFKAIQKISRSEDKKLFEYRRDTNMISRATTLPFAMSRGENQILIQGMAVMKEHRMVAQLEPREVGLSLLLKENEVEEMNYSVKVKEEQEEINISFARIHLKQKSNYMQTDPVKWHISVSGSGEVREFSNGNFRSSQDFLKKVEEQVSRNIREELEKLIKKLQNENVEPWLFGHHIFQSDSDYFKQLEWEEKGWKNAQFEIEVDFKIENTGQRGLYDKRKIGR